MPGARTQNFDTEGELSLFTVPVEWRTQDGNARIGILAVSSSQPDFIPDSLRVRVELLGHIIGFLISLYATEKRKTLDNEAADYSPKDSLPIGLNMREGISAQRFIRRVVALRRQIASHFEATFQTDGIHIWDGNELVVTTSRE